MKWNFFFFAALLCSASYSQQFSEICPSNVSVYSIDVDEETEFPDWLELYNPSAVAINLAGFSLSDDVENPTKWVFPALTMEANGFLTISLSDEIDLPEGVDFSLGRKGGLLLMYDTDGTLLDSITRPTLEPNHSYGRIDGKWYFFENPTPTAANTTSIGYKGYCPQPVINRNSGKQSFGATVVIRPQNPEEEVYYSKNGTKPLTAKLYTAPLVLNTNTSLRVAAVRDSMLPSPDLYRTYFVNTQHQLPIVHLNIDSLELLDEEIGIYVLGPDASEEYPYFGANFWKDIEIHAYYEFFLPDLEPGEALDCGVKIHGGTVSTTRPMKSLRLVAHDRYEQEEFSYPYFANKQNSEFRRLLLRNSGSDFDFSLLKDGTLHQFVIDNNLDVDAQGYQPVMVYINGIFWGIHNLREKIDKYYVTSNYNIPADSVNLLEEEELILISGDSATFIELRDFALSNNLEDESNFNWVDDRLDTKSMVDYFIMELFMNNRDWPYNNLKLWNAPSQPRWRYFYSDLDAGIKYYGKELIDFYSLAYILGPYGDGNVHVQLFKRLLENATFKRYFINRYADLMNTILQADYLMDYIYQAKENIASEIQTHYFRWGGSVEEWDSNFLKFETFFEDRVQIVREELAVVFEKPEALNMYMGMYPATSGTVQLNTLNLADFPFEGKYYSTNKIDLTATAAAGKQFLYWENLTTGIRYESPSIQIDPALNDSLVAVFESENLFNLTLYPVPVTTAATLRFSLPSSAGVSIKITTVNGTSIVEKQIPYLAKGSYKEMFDSKQWAAGIYVLTLSTNYGQESIRFVKAR